MTSSPAPRKSMGQHWLNDQASLSAVIEAADVGPEDTVLEVGPGPGSLTRLLATRAKQVVAVELDPYLVQTLPGRLSADNVEVIHADILRFDLRTLPEGYKVVANIPYYLTSKLIRVLLESPRPPAVTALLVQKEVAERLAAEPGALSILGVSAQFYAEVSTGMIIPAELFSPPPEVDSQIVRLKPRGKPLFEGIRSQDYFRVVRAGFSEKRKKLRSSLSGGLAIPKQDADQLLEQAGIPADARAQELSLEQWYSLAESVVELSF